ncbi:hypothetical protein ACF8MD_05655, partial [Pseudomonas sp. zjy_8]
AATCRTCQAMVARLGACLETGGAASMPTSKSSHASKADNHGLTGMATLQQMRERRRDAPRGRRSI